MSMNKQIHVIRKSKRSVPRKNNMPYWNTNPNEEILFGSRRGRGRGRPPRSQCSAMNCFEGILVSKSLEAWVQTTFGLLGSLKKLRRRTVTIAGYVIKTLEKFQQSDDVRVKPLHVYWKATMVGFSEKLEWRAKVGKNQYVAWAQELFDPVYQFCSEFALHQIPPPVPEHVDITHDGYLKAFHIARSFRQQAVVGSSTQYDVIIVDESQDMSACQASVLWGSSRRHNNNPTVYLVGDDRQMLYRFRGASRYFEACTASKDFSLTGSFRFGETIGRIATLALQQKGHSQDRVQGLAQQEGQVLPAEQFHKGVVICRTNNGIYQYLQAAKPPRWALYSKNTAASPQQYYQDLNRLLLFMRGLSKAYLYEAEVFGSFAELEDFCTETDQTDMLNKIAMVKKYDAEATDMIDLFGGLQNSFVSDWRSRCSSIDDFDGVVLLTCHKAKGLEFQNVLCYDDFRFEDIMKLEKEKLLAIEYCREMIDLVYVAFTRTKETLFLCEGGMKYIEWLEQQHQQNQSEGTARMDSNLLTTGTSLLDLREDMELNWYLFVNGTSTITAVNDVPWPLGPEDNPFCFEPRMNRSEQVKGYKTMLLRFHPDKFFQNFGERLDLEDDQPLRQKLNQLTQIATRLRRDLRPHEQA